MHLRGHAFRPKTLWPPEPWQAACKCGWEEEQRRTTKALALTDYHAHQAAESAQKPKRRR